MNRDTIIIIIGWIIVTVMLLIYVNKNKIRHAILIFLAKQCMTWLFGILVVEFNLIEYPVRSFANGTRTSFDFEFYMYPAFCAIFNLHYPKEKGFIGQFLHYFYYCTSLTIIEVIVERHTEIINYIHWTWYITWITFCLTFYISRKFYLWFFKLNTHSKTG
jgi:hypothetical protein